eukprot:GEMP01020828.1.p1 GENE.GEMP01020828.1~~GEMP01020828.1.p1  ORF type:complete len:406 (+),score=96.95 GEMP01020828.1:22-1218(+)
MAAAVQTAEPAMLLDDIRVNITRIDNEILKLLSERRALSVEVAKTKVGTAKPVRDLGRELALLRRLTDAGKELKLDAHYVTDVFQYIIEDSVLMQQAYLQQRKNPNVARNGEASVAFLGPKGSYSDMATTSYFARKNLALSHIGCSTFRAILSMVEEGGADYGVLPIENACSGSITEAYDQLQHTSLSVVGEITRPINHCILVAVETTIDKVTTLYSHSQPFLQCSQFVSSLGSNVLKQTCASTSDAMQKVQELQSPHYAAIGSVSGGELYGLKPLKTDLADQLNNWTRFIVVARKPVQVTELVPAKTTLIMATGQYPGALLECLSALSKFNMTKLESRPNKRKDDEYLFFVDVDANTQSDDMKTALLELGRRARHLRVLGCYPVENVEPVETEVPAG